MKTNDVKKNRRIAAKGGSYSLVLTAVVIAILIAVNVLVSVVPAALTKHDMTATNLYSVTSSTKAVVNTLTKDVTIYWIVQADKEDKIIENLLGKYESLSGHLSVVKKNPDVYPTFAAKYTDKEVPNNSLIVECGEKSRYISFDDIYLKDTDPTNYSYVYSFDGEGAVTSAIDYVVSDKLPKVYALEGHGEAELPAGFRTQIEKANLELASISLLNQDAVPEDADALLIYAPSTDISQEEATLLVNYLNNGGKLLLIAGPNEGGTLTNLFSVPVLFGLKAEEGLVIESDRAHYAFQQPYILLPDIQSDAVTDPLIEEKYYVIFPLAGGISVNSTAATALLMSSSDSFIKAAGFDLKTYEKEEGDTDGPFALAASAKIGNEGKLIWFASGYFLDENYNAYSSGANLNLAMNALSSLIGEREALSIRSKSLSYKYLTIADSSATTLKIVLIGVVPAVFVLWGIFTVIDRRKKRHA